jgi:hypothetical protein
MKRRLDVMILVRAGLARIQKVLRCGKLTVQRLNLNTVHCCNGGQYGITGQQDKAIELHGLSN